MKRVNVISIVILVSLLAGLKSICQGVIIGDKQWNYRQEARDYFHSNEAWLRPWDGTDQSHGRFVGNYSYQVTWGAVSRIGNASGGFTVNNGRDYQWHAWCYAYVSEARNINISLNGDCVPRAFLGYNFDNPLLTNTLSLVAGWNRIDVTGYNQNSGYDFTFSGIASQVEIQSSSQIDLTPHADFIYSPVVGWSGTTAFEFTDNSSEASSEWLWDIDNDGTDDYMMKNVASHFYTVAAGTAEEFDVKLQVSGFGQTDTAVKENIIMIYGLPIASFVYDPNGLEVAFTNQSVEPGKIEMGGYQYRWDMDGDGYFDDSNDENPTYLFSDPGDYLVSFQVQNGAGDAVYSETIRVGPRCGDDNHPYPIGDISGPNGQPDCWVDLNDLAALAANWLICTSPQSPCNYVVD